MQPLSCGHVRMVNGHPSTTKLFLDRGCAAVNVADNGGETALHIACL